VLTRSETISQAWNDLKLAMLDEHLPR